MARRKNSIETLKGPPEPLSNIRKVMGAHTIVLSKNPFGTYLVSVGHPNLTSSKLLFTIGGKQRMKDWVRDNIPHTYSPNHVIDLTGSRFVPKYYTQWYANNVNYPSLKEGA